MNYCIIHEKSHDKTDIKKNGYEIMTTTKIIKDVAESFAEVVKNVPDGFYDTFEFTKRGKNLTHPWTWGRLIEISSKLEGVEYTLVDCRNNANGRKFQPDITAVDDDYSPLLYVDYESPNSSDARIPSKNVDNYVLWDYLSIPYIIITTLPKKKSPGWQLRYSYKGGTNEHHKKNIDKIQKNPCDYWYSFYRDELRKYDNHLDNIYFINIDGKQISFESIH